MIPKKEKFDEEWESNIINLIFTTPSWFEQNSEYLDPKYVDSQEYSSILKIVKEFNAKYDTIPEPKVLLKILKKEYKGEALESVITALDTALSNEITPSSIQFITDDLRTNARKKKYRDILLASSDKLMENDLDGIQGLFDVGVSYGSVSDSDDIFYFDNLEQRKTRDDSVEKIPTLHRSLDEKTRGGISKKELWMFLAPPYRGKSAGLVDIGSNALMAGKNVLHVTVEMSKEKTQYRYDSHIAGMSYDEIVLNPKKFTEVANKFKSLHKGQLVIKEYPARSATPTDVSNYIKLLARRHGLIIDLLVLDYVDELKRPKMDNPSYAIGEVVANLRSLTMKHNIGIWTATQTTRGGFSKTRLDLDDVADSWDKVKVSDGIVAMCQTEDEEMKEEMRWVILKNRDNKRWSKPILMRTKLEHMRFKEVG